MSALRQPSIPNIHREAVVGEAALRLALRLLPSDQAAVLERITHLRCVPNGEPVEWREVALRCNLINTRARQPERVLDLLRPYVWLLAGLLHAGANLGWREVAAHPWVRGCIAEATLYNKRATASLPGGGKLAQWISDFEAAVVEEQRRLASEFAEQDAVRSRKALLKTLSLVEAQQQRITPSDEHLSQLGLNLDSDADERGRVQEFDRLEREDSLSRIHDRQSATIERVYRNLRLINSQNPDEPDDPQDALPSTPEALAARLREIEAEEAAEAAAEAALDAELAGYDTSAPQDGMED